MLQNFKLLIEYDGTSYNGWQIQKNGRTIQGEIEKALSIMTGKKIVITGSGRTDAGVHAFGQTANFICNTEISSLAFQKGLNSLTPEDIIIKSCQCVEKDFHSRFSAKSKIYIYRILNSEHPSAVCRWYAWHIRKKLDLDLMRCALDLTIGRHDFKAFEGSGSPRPDTTRIIFNTKIEKKNHNYIHIKIEANGFLRYMMRNIAGTLVDVGTGKITTDTFNKILLSKDRNLAGITAPAHGLFLMHVRYANTQTG